ncbi:Receptor-like protein kinase HAIKU2 [Hibiscus syriacus]|uniref:Receptor-like protein kinase HAIKU2 n=1 Tax=Hibiscus syriacus TaxID=106335 RepID=A0A6A3BUV2_HIBSY|nr:Receptor-like protein kinase HAIKU2 [Hibiscus syriacus]
MSVRRSFRQWPPPVIVFSLSFIFLISRAKSDEVEILLKFKSTVESSASNVFSSWKQGNSACNFSGVVCNSNGFVTEINLPQQRIRGYVPFDSICELQSLEKIDVGNNSFHGKVSDDLKKCTRLRYLDLGVNAISGEVPNLSSLDGLKFLNLNNSGFSGIFPWKSLENLTELAFLSLGDNPFDESPFPLEVLKLEKLYWLYLTNCSITGQIPEGIQNLSLLQNLELSDNRLYGPIPAGIGKLNQLWQLELYNNSLSGKLPVGFGNLTNLKNFDASMNMLEGDLSELRSLKNLASLQLLENQFSGEFPAEFGEFKHLEGLSYTTRYVQEWQDHELLLLQNNFTGTLPESYANCKSLVRLRVNNNSLSGTVPAGIWSLPNLSIIDLTMNRFEGPITGDIGNSKSLAQLFLANNQFSGELPASISQASSLVSVQLTSNRFTGQIPEAIGELKRLGSLYLNGNMFSGVLPDSLGSCVSLNELNLAGNSLSGNIPESIGYLRNLNSLNLSENKLSGEIPASLSSSRLSLLDLSNNGMVGPIPKSLSIQAFKDGFEGNPGLCSSDLNFQPCSSNAGTRSSHLRMILSCFIAGILVLLVSLGCYMFVRAKRSNLDRPLKQGSWNMISYRMLSFTEKDIIDAVKPQNLIGKGGSGNVYKIELGDGKELAVKHIWTSDSSNRRIYHSSTAMLTPRSFRSLEYNAEVAALSAISMLHSCHKMEMNWETRYTITLGAARGLEYLHHGCDRPVIHRDVKSSNILLDEEWKPRIADFGLAKIVQDSGGGEWTNFIAGTHGYMAPEYAYTSNINEKSDVYSFGVVLMELVTGKRPVEPEFEENKDIVHWIYTKLRTKETLAEVVDSNISTASKEDAIKVLRIAVHCTARIPTHRPSMRKVVQMLEEAEPCKLTDIIVHKKGDCSPTEEWKNNGKLV